MILALACGIAHAEFQVQPDDNTLWRETGKAIQIANKQPLRAWESGNLQIEENPDGNGFTIAAYDRKKYTTHRYVPFNPDYPWFVYEIIGVEQKKGYVAYTFITPGGNAFSQISVVDKGVFAVKLFENKPVPNQKQCSFRFDLYGLALTFAYWQQVKEPANYIFAESAAFEAKKSFSNGDTIKFIVKLAKSAEDVTLRLYNPYMMKPLAVNQQDKLQLKPVDTEAKVWTVEVKINSLTGKMDRMSYIQTRATILGGELKEPLWGAVYYPYQKPESK